MRQEQLYILEQKSSQVVVKRANAALLATLAELYECRDEFGVETHEIVRRVNISTPSRSTVDREAGVR